MFLYNFSFSSSEFLLVSIVFAVFLTVHFHVLFQFSNFFFIVIFHVFNVLMFFLFSFDAQFQRHDTKNITSMYCSLFTHLRCKQLIRNLQLKRVFFHCQSAVNAFSENRSKFIVFKFSFMFFLCFFSKKKRIERDEKNVSIWIHFFSASPHELLLSNFHHRDCSKWWMGEKTKRTTENHILLLNIRSGFVSFIGILHVNCDCECVNVWMWIRIQLFSHMVLISSIGKRIRMFHLFQFPIEKGNYHRSHLYAIFSCLIVPFWSIVHIWNGIYLFILLYSDSCPFIQLNFECKKRIPIHISNIFFPSFLW